MKWTDLKAKFKIMSCEIEGKERKVIMRINSYAVAQPYI